jgi:hypothetical protein
METRVKISHFTHQHKALLDNFGRKSFASNILGCESISNHNIALASFDDEIWLNQWQYIVQHWAGCLPVINRACELLFTRPSISRIFRSAKVIFEPYYKLFIATSYLEHAMPLKAVAIFALFYIANIQAALSINKASEICDLSNIMIGEEFNYFSHEFPFINNIAVINEEVHAERLSEKNLQIDVSTAFYCRYAIV